MNDVTVFSNEEIESRLVAHAAWEATSMAEVLDLLSEFDRRRLWDNWGAYSAQQWLGWKCGLGYVAACERLRVARALRALPWIREALSRGKLSYSKVRELTRVATSATDQCLGEIATAATAAQVATLVRQMRRRTPRDALRQMEGRGMRWHVDDDDGSVVITLKLPADVGMQVVRTIDAAARPVKGVPAHQNRADAAVELVCGDPDGRPRPQLVVHQEATHSYVDDGPALTPEIAECLGCDGAVVTVEHREDGPVVVTKAPPASASQRRWLALRHKECQVEGCHHTGRFEVHHVLERARGGTTTLPNLVRVCAFHHRLIHVLHLRVELQPDRRMQMWFPDGTPLDRPVSFAPYLAPPAGEPGWISGTWCGERLDLDDALVAVGSHERRATATAAA
jgi:hypothetical protein